MNLLHDILKWTESLPAWQRDAARRLFQSESGLTADDYAELYALLKKENGIEVDNSPIPIPLASEQLPTELAPGQTVTLVALRDLQNVNQIPSNCTLPFSETGMTVIYGGNGSGKSGYAKVMKRACRARDQSEPVHPNANDPAAASKVPTAKFDVKAAGVSEEILWSRDAAPPPILSTVSVFDSKCARHYITSEHDVAYLPYGLDIVESLANLVLPKLSSMLEAEIRAIDVSTFQFEHLLGETDVGKAIGTLSAKSDADEISALGTVTGTDCKRLAELEVALKETDPLSKAKELRLSAMRLKAYSERTAKPLVWVNVKAVDKLKDLVHEKELAEAAEAKAADALRAGEELLPGTGGQEWKLLFEAARRYSTEVADRGEVFPPSVEGKVCPLCQESLDENAIQRLNRFNTYIKDDVATAADSARKMLDTAKGRIEAADLQVTADAALADELNELEVTLLQYIGEFQASIESRRRAMLDCLKTAKWNEIPTLVDSPRARVRQLAANQLKACRTLMRAADEKEKKELQKELKELAARQNLSKSLKLVLELLERIKRKALLEKCRLGLNTRPISLKSRELAAVAVTEQLKKALDKEFDALGVGHIKTKLKERNDRGKMHHQLLLDLPTVNKIEEILSEGEQRAIALGSFFAELALANHCCGIVFDDPVSSLDHWRRQNVVRRLVEEAKVRQVIIFTHDTSFLGQLRDEIEAAAVTASMLFLEWRGGFPGSVNDGLPWDHQGYKARIDALEQAQNMLSKAWPTYPTEKVISEIRHQYDRLRATLERVIQDVVFNGVVKRYRDWVRVDSLEDVVGFERAEYDAINKLHKRCCNIVTAHDPSSAKAAAVPTATDLRTDIDSLKAIIEMIRHRRRAAKAVPN